jgi:hypothetical protein
MVDLEIESYGLTHVPTSPSSPAPTDLNLSLTGLPQGMDTLPGTGTSSGSGGGTGGWTISASMSLCSRFPDLFQTIFDDINRNSYCIVPVDEINTWFLKVDPIWKVPPPIYDHQVPVPLIDFEAVFTGYVYFF